MKDHAVPLSEIQELAALQDRMQRPARNVNRDGSFELGWGTALLCAGFGPYLVASLPKSVWSSAWTSWLGFVPVLCMAFAPWGIPKIVQRFITWPRTGYVANPQDVTLKQLVMLMVFGGALGFSLVLPFILVPQIREAISQAGAHKGLHDIILNSIKLLVCATLVVWLGRKVISKRQPLPSAYDPVIIKQAFKQSPVGRKSWRQVRFFILAIFLGAAILVCGAVFGLIYLRKLARPFTEFHWPQMGVSGFLVATNALLYLMANGVAFKQHRWKWLLLAIMLVGPILAGPAIPLPASQLGMSSTFAPLLPVMLSVGVVWFLSGAATLMWFIWHNPPSSEPSA
jgi:hypothetical protein